MCADSNLVSWKKSRDSRAIRCVLAIRLTYRTLPFQHHHNDPNSYKIFYKKGCDMRRCVKWPQIKICQHDVTSSESSCVLRLQCTQNICPVMFCRSPSLPLFPDSDSKLFPFMDRLPQKGLRKWECKIKTSSWVPSLTVDLPSQGRDKGAASLALSSLAVSWRVCEQLQRDLRDFLSPSCLGG